jgi:adhesin HecA-like repeat protein
MPYPKIWTRSNANQTYQNEGKDTIAQANLAITANTVNNQGGQLAGAALVFDLTSPVV